MSDCEHTEILLSTWLDGQLEREAQIECLDHLVRCAACRAFYADARALEGLVALVRQPDAGEPPSPRLWARIESAAREDAAGGARRGIPPWALRVAAGVVVLLGITLAVWNGGFAPVPRSDEVVLGRGGDMTEARFVDLTREILGADSRYRLAMYRILSQVARDTGEAGEVSTDEAVDRSDEAGAAERVEVATRRIPA